MNKAHTIEYTRTRKQVQKLYFNKRFWKVLIFPTIVVIFVFPLTILLAFFATAALGLLLDVDFSTTLVYISTAFFSLLFVYPFVMPIIGTYKMVKSHLNKLFKRTNTITVRCLVCENEFSYQNDYYKYITKWDNVRIIEVDETGVILQSNIPEMLFYLPGEKINPEAFALFEEKISLSSKS